MIHYGNGFTMLELYNMPTKLRLFYYKKLVDAKKKENDEVKQSQNASKVRIRR